MKRNIKTLKTAFAALLCFFVFNLAYSQAPTVVINFNPTNLVPGSTIHVPVVLNGTNVGTWNLLIHYNTSALTWVSTTSSGLPAGFFGSTGTFAGLPPFSPPEILFKASLAYTGGAPCPTYVNQTIFTINFTYIGGNPDLYFKYISTGTSGNNVTYVMSNPCDAVNTATQFDNPFIPGSISASQTICYNTAPAQLVGVPPTGGATPYSYQWQNSTDNITYADISGATSLNYTPGPLTTTTYYRQKQYSSDIQGPDTTNVVTITVYPAITASNNGPLCIGSTLNLTGGPSGMTTYSWTGPNGFTSGAQNPSIPSVTLANAGLYTLTVTAPGCTGTATTTVTVTPNNTITLTSAAGTNAQTVCINTPITNITYATTGATGATFLGLPTGVTGAWASNVVTLSGTPSVSGPFSYTVTLTGGCNGGTATGTITVTPNNTITLTSAVGTNAQTVCINTPITNITYATTGATGATFAGLPTGVTGAWASNVVTISGTPSVSGPFSYTVTMTGGCGAGTATGTITVTPNNTITLTSAVGTNAQTVCINTPITPITYATTGATGASFAGLPTGVTGAWASNLVTISGTPTVSGPFSYTVTLTGGCGTITATGTITVTPNNTITLTSAVGTNAQTVCINTPITNISYATTGATGATFAGLPTGVLGAWASNIIIISGTPSVSGPFSYTITLTGGCGTITATGTITVTPNNTITLTSAVGTNAQTLCINTPITNITYATTGATGATFAGLPTGVTGAWASNVVTISGTPTVSGPFSYTVTLTGGCGTITATGTITVNPNNTITLTSAVGTNAQTVCINTPITNITYATTGATGATFAGLPTGVTGAWASNVVTISGTPSVSGPFSYTVTLTGGCGTTTATGTITVTPNNTITLTSGAGTNIQTVCINTPITTITYSTTGATGATFAGLPTGVTGAWASNVVTISGTPTVSGTFNYTVTLTGGCGTITATGSILVNPINTITLTSAVGTNAQTVCINTPIINITYATTIATGATFAGLPTGVTGAWASNVVTISGTPTVSGPFSYTITLTGGCGTITATGTITVTPNNTITLTSGAGSNIQTLCINIPITNITYATTGATGATFSGLPTGVTGAWASNVVTISGTPTVSGTFNYTVTLTGGCGTITATGTITVTPNNTITLTSAAGTNAQTVCINTAITNITYSTTGATGATFAGLPTGVTGAWASNVVTISGTPTVSGPFSYTITLTGGCGTITATGTITVRPISTITLTSAAGTDAQTVCINTPILNITYATTTATGATFSGLPAGVTGAWASNVVTISGTPTASGTFNYTVTLTGGCGNITATGSITVTPNNTITLTSGAGTNIQTVCINTPITTITYSTTGATGANFAGLPAGVTGVWLVNVVTISGTPTVSGTFNYTVTLTGGCGNITATGTITVKPINTIALTSAAGTDAQTVCINTPILNITYATTTATGATFSGLPAGVTGVWASNVVTISGTPTVSGTFNYTVTLTGGCGTISASGTITVNPVNTITLTSAAGTDAQTVCINIPITNITYATTGATGATFSGLPAGVTGAWAANVVTISGTPTVSGTFSYTVTLTGGCGIITATGTINVTPNNTITLTSAVGTNAQTVCINTAIANITYATTGATGATFSGLPTGVTGAWAANVVTISGTPSVSGTFNYTVTLTGGCGIITATGSITVTPNNTITLTSGAGTNNQSACANSPITTITYATTGATGATFSGLPAGVTGAWAVNVVTISGTPTIIGIYNYTVTLTGGCGTITAAGTITVNPNNTITLTSAVGTNAQTVCINTAIINITYATTGATGVTVSGLPAGVTGSWASNVVTISGTPTVSGTFNFMVTLTGGCGTVTSIGSIQVTPSNTITLTSGAGTNNQTKCVNSPITNITYTTTGATGATFSGLPAGVTGTWSSNVVTISGTPTATGVFNYTITLTGGCGAIPTTGTITVLPLPVPTITGQTSMCVNSGYYLYTTEPGMTGYVWATSLGGVINYGSGTNQIQVSWIASGPQTVSVTYSNGTCSAATPTVLNITVNPLPSPAGTITGSASVCAGANGVAYSVAPIANATTYVWTLPPNAVLASGGGTNSITVNFPLNALSGNIYVFGNNLCGDGTSSPAFAVTVNALPAPAGTITGPASVCEGALGVVYSVPTIANASGYSWTVPAGAIITGGGNTNSITVNFSLGASSGFITVTGTNSCGNGTMSPEFAVTVNPIPPAPVVTNNGYTAVSSAPAGNQWYYSPTPSLTGILISGATAQTYDATLTGTGYYWSIVTLNGCSSDSSNHKLIITVGIDPLSSSSINIYPVPNDGRFNVSITTLSSESFSISVYNDLGVKIYDETKVDVNGSLQKVIDLRPVPTGVYSVVFVNSQNQVVKKIIVNK